VVVVESLVEELVEIVAVVDVVVVVVVVAKDGHSVNRPAMESVLSIGASEKEHEIEVEVVESRDYCYGDYRAFG